MKSNDKDEGNGMNQNLLNMRCSSPARMTARGKSIRRPRRTETVPSEVVFGAGAECVSHPHLHNITHTAKQGDRRGEGGMVILSR